MTRAELLALAERVENAAGPEIIKEALFAIRAMEREAYLAARRFDDWDQRAERWIGDLQRFAAGAYIDAAASLQIPGWSQSVWNRSDGISEAHVERDSPPSEAWGATSGMTPDAMARALTAAWLRARAEEAGE